MTNNKKIKIAYVTSSKFKQEENVVFLKECAMKDGRRMDEVFQFDIREVHIQEILAVDLIDIVTAEVKSAYSKLKIPCIVEHAGLIFNEYYDQSYPGGLTKPMWNSLQDRFIVETKSAGRGAIARAVVAYCDGMKIETFIGERKGKISDKPRGDRSFYWDTVFIPDDPSGRCSEKTYAEIVADSDYGLQYKVRELSQSSIAMKKFLEFRIDEGEPKLWL